MGTTLIFVGQRVCDEWESVSGLIGLARLGTRSRKQPPHQTVPQTDTGGLVEYTQALERMVLKELGKLPS
ncbi:hypothetical protein D3C71_1252160 [compost metagenome]